MSPGNSSNSHSSLEYWKVLVIVVLVQPFEFGRLERLGQLLEVLVEKPEHPLEQNQLLVERQGPRFSGGGCGP